MIAAPIVGILLLILLFNIIFNVTIPSSHYKKGMTAYEAGDYATAIEEFEKAKRYSNAPQMVIDSQNAIHYQNGQDALAAGDYSLANSEFEAAGDFQDAEQMANNALLQGHYVEGEALFDNADYEAAAAEFAAAADFEDASDRMREAYYNLASEQFDAGDYIAAAESYGNASGYEDSEDMLIYLGNQCLANADYTNAIQFYGYSSDPRYANYAQGVAYMAEGSFEDAISAFENAVDLNDAPDMVLTCHYNLGLQNLIDGNYSTAAFHFGKIGTFNGGDILLLVAEAEDANSDSHLNIAVEKYSQVPSDFAVEGFDVQARRSIFTGSTASSFAALCADYSVESNTINCTDEGPYGYSNGWSLTDVVSDQNLFIDCRYADGSYVISGSFKILVMTEYSVLRDFVDGDYYYQTFEITDLTSVPSSISLDEDDTITLSFSGNQVTAHYRVVDNYAVGWEYVYDTKTTFVRE